MRLTGTGELLKVLARHRIPAISTAGSHLSEETLKRALYKTYLSLPVLLSPLSTFPVSPFPTFPSPTLLSPVSVLLPELEAPPTAAEISSSVASKTMSFWVKMHPLGSLASSQVLPAAVGSLTSPGANVPAFNASRGSPPTAAICFASSSVMSLLVSAAPSDAGSCIYGY